MNKKFEDFAAKERATQPIDRLKSCQSDEACHTQQVDIFPIKKFRSVDSAKQIFQQFAESQGFPMFAVALQKYHADGKVFRAAISSYPASWLAQYERKTYILVDPVMQRANDSAIPFCWDELSCYGRRQQAFIREAVANGLSQGITIPLHMTSGEKIMLSLAGRSLPDSQPERWQLLIRGYEFLCQSAGPMYNLLLKQDNFSRSIALTNAQCEVLQLLLQGRTAKEIARMLKIHIRAVEDRLARACERLNATTRTQALIRALNSGQIYVMSEQTQKLCSLDLYVHVPRKEPD